MLRQFFAFVFCLLALPTITLAECRDRDAYDALPQELRDRVETAEAAAPFGRGNFWAVEKGGVRSYVYGTMHFYDSRHQPWIDQIQPHIAEVDQVVLEVTAEDEKRLEQVIMSDPSLVFITEGPSLIDRLGEEAWAKLLPKLEAYDIPGFMAAKMQPWVLNLSMMVPECDLGADLDKPGADEMIEQHAQALNKPLRALDQIDELLQLLAGEPLEEQVEMFKWSLELDLPGTFADTPMVDLYFEERAWLAGLAADAMIDTLEVSEADRLRIEQVLEDMLSRLVDERNMRWLDRIGAELETTSSFIAVGALHLGGEMGVLNLLQQRGFTVTRLPLGTS